MYVIIRCIELNQIRQLKKARFKSQMQLLSLLIIGFLQK